MPKPKQHRLTIRLTPEEYAELQTKAGDKPLAAFVRTAALEQAARRRKTKTRNQIQDRVALAQILALLGNSDLVRDFHCAARDVANGAVPTDETIEQTIARIEANLTQIRALLMRALGVPER